MLKGLFSASSPFTQFIMLGFCMIASFLLAILIGVLFVPLILDIPFADFFKNFDNSEIEQNLNLMRYRQVIFGIGLFIIPALVAAYLFSNAVSGYFGLKRAPSAKWFVATMLLMLMSIPFINLLSSLNEMIVFPKSLSGLEQRLKDFEDVAQQATKLFLNADGIGGMFFNIFMIALLPALGEELIFRGVLQKIFTRWTGNVHIAIMICSLMFSLMHFQFYGFFPRWLLGVLLGYLMIWSGTIWLPIFAHFVNNTVAALCYYMIGKGIISEKIEDYGASFSDIPVTIVTTAVAILLFWKIYQRNKTVIEG